MARGDKKLGGYTLEALLGAEPITKVEAKPSLIGRIIGAPFRLVAALVRLPLKLVRFVLLLPFRVVRAILPPWGRKGPGEGKK